MPYMDGGVRREGPLLGRGVRIQRNHSPTPSVLPFLCRPNNSAASAKPNPQAPSPRRHEPMHQLAEMRRGVLSPRSPDGGPLTKTQKHRQVIALLRQRADKAHGPHKAQVVRESKGLLLPRPPPGKIPTRYVQDIGAFDRRGANILNNLRVSDHAAIAVEKPFCAVAASPTSSPDTLRTPELLPLLASPPESVLSGSSGKPNRMWSDEALRARRNIDNVGTRQWC